MALALALLLAVAAACDLWTRRIPNGLATAGLAIGLGGHFWQGGMPGLLLSLAGIAAALPLLYSLRAFGAGDVKLLMAVGALTGPVFLLWALLGSLFAGAALALVWLIGTVLLTCSWLPRKSRMPFAPAIAAGAVFAFLHLHLALSRL